MVKNIKKRMMSHVGVRVQISGDVTSCVASLAWPPFPILSMLMFAPHHKFCGTGLEVLLTLGPIEEFASTA